MSIAFGNNFFFLYKKETQRKFFLYDKFNARPRLTWVIPVEKYFDRFDRFDRFMDMKKMTEHQHQVAFIAWARKHYPEVMLFAIPNGGARHPTVAAKLKAEGVLAGVPDLFVADGRPGLFIEMKAAEGRISASQKKLIPQLNDAGYPVAVCYGFEEAKAAFINYLESK